MRHHKMITIAALATVLVTSACGRPEPDRTTARDEPAHVDAAAELQRKHYGEAAELDKRVADLERRWTEMESKVAQKSLAPTAALRAEVKEDVENVRMAVAGLKTTTPENWWERHENAMERTTADIEEDVRRFGKGQKTSAPPREPENPVTAAPFTSRRDRFVTNLRTRVDSMEAQLKDVRVRDAQKMELEDTRARITKLKDDVDRLANASGDDWWDISFKRVNEYVDRVADSIRRLNDNKK